MKLERLDHLVLTVQSLEASTRFYQHVLGMEIITFGQNRKAAAFGQQKINFHEAGHEIDPKALRPTPGSGDLCFLSAVPLSDVIAHLNATGTAIELGPVPRSGALGPIISVYIRDPDGNLIEISVPDNLVKG
ncbi:VOC family protein [Paenibacillus filicis]|uniref:VOC family protein n=1 Tax=Paenibacillus filicis TaxID=669464 RepID=A0ABU9DIS2_9BACL